MRVPAVKDLFDLGGQAAIVTGASQGIGAAIARRLAEAGARVAVHYRGNSQGAEATVAAIRDAGGEATALAADLATAGAAEELAAAAGRELGGLDILVNNAGTFPAAPLIDMAAEDWRDMFRTNVETAFLCTQAAARRMRDAGRGAIVNVASIEALDPGPAHGHYSSAKAAVVMLTRAAAQEFGEFGIRVNAVSPGVIARAGIEEQWPEGVERWRARAPLARLGEPGDVADACLFLASPAARWISGHNLVVDGGVMAASAF